jgi:hypothetical protein
VVVGLELWNIFYSAAVACIGGMYEKLGRMVGRSYEETVALLIKSLKNAEVFIVQTLLMDVLLRFVHD